MNIKSKEDAKGMIEEVKAKGDEAIAKQLDKMSNYMMVGIATKGLIEGMKLLKAYESTGDIRCLLNAKDLLKNSVEIIHFAQVGIDEDIATAQQQNTKPNNDGI